MSSSVDTMPAFYVPNQILFRFVADDDASNNAFPPAQDKQGLRLPEWLWGDLQDAFPDFFKGKAIDHPVYPLFPSEAGRTVVLAQLALVESEDDSVLAIAKLSGVLGRSKSFSNGQVTLTLSDVSPNWFSGGAGQTIGTGGPGGPPQKPSGNSQIKGITFTRAAAIPDAFPRSVPNDVDVFILDTLSAHAERDAEGIVNNVESCDDRLFNDLVKNNVPLYAAANPYYDMSDHGVFIAGIIRNIAPNATIHLIKVLNEYGVGTTMSMAAGCAKVALLRRSNTTPCIVNCSFTLSVPINPQLVRWPLKVKANPHPEAEFFSRLLGDFAAELMEQAGDLFGSILKFVVPTDADSACVTIVAAAGNDSKAGELPCPPRYPAALPNILGVGAMEGTQRAYFSNIPDSPETVGLMTLGTMRSVYFSSTFPIVVGGVVMPFTAPGTVPLLPANTYPRTGPPVADWSGTSFAAPVIAGYLARQMRQPNMTCAQALAELRSLVVAQEPDTKGRIVDATQS